MRSCSRGGVSPPISTSTAATRCCRSRTICRTSKVFPPNSEAQMKPSTGNPAPGYKKYPGHRIETKPAGVRVRVTFKGEVIADTKDAIALEEAMRPGGSTVAPVVYYI